MKTFWSYVSTFLSGVVAALVLFIKLKSPDQVINETNNIGKVKQIGDGNNADLKITDQLSESRKEIRQQRRAERRAARIARREARRAEREKRKYMEE
jgi:uncharacterized membrane protein